MLQEPGSFSLWSMCRFPLMSPAGTHTLASSFTPQALSCTDEVRLNAGPQGQLVAVCVWPSLHCKLSFGNPVCVFHKTEMTILPLLQPHAYIWRAKDICWVFFSLYRWKKTFVPLWLLRHVHGETDRKCLKPYHEEDWLKRHNFNLNQTHDVISCCKVKGALRNVIGLCRRGGVFTQFNPRSQT